MKSLWSLGFGLAMISLGCSRSNPAYVKVSGRVVDAKGKPVPLLKIRLIPTENRERFKVPHIPTTSGQPRVTSLNYPLADGNKDGTFTLTMGDKDGVPPGKYNVMLQGSKEQNSMIPSAYQHPSNSPLQITIPTKGVSDLVLRIE